MAEVEMSSIDAKEVVQVSKATAQARQTTQLLGEPVFDVLGLPVHGEDMLAARKRVLRANMDGHILDSADLIHQAPRGIDP
ncbi:unnamed protein product, partial [Ilex paraguariensis]